CSTKSLESPFRLGTSTSTRAGSWASFFLFRELGGLGTRLVGTSFVLSSSEHQASFPLERKIILLFETWILETFSQCRASYCYGKRVGHPRNPSSGVWKGCSL